MRFFILLSARCGSGNPDRTAPLIIRTSVEMQA